MNPILRQLLPFLLPLFLIFTLPSCSNPIGGIIKTLGPSVPLSADSEWKKEGVVKEVRIAKLLPDPSLPNPAMISPELREMRKTILSIEGSHRPELVMSHSYSKGTAETIHRTRALLNTPHTQRLSVITELTDTEYRYTVEDGGVIEKHLKTLNLGARFQYDNRLALSAGITPYQQGHRERVGVTFGAELTLNQWLTTMLEIKGNHPWAESTQSLAEDGTTHGVRSSITLALPQQLSLTLDGEANAFILTDGPFGTGTLAGQDLAGGARIDLTLFSAPRQVGQGFLDPTGQYQEAFNLRLSAYGAVRRHLRDSTTAGETVPVTPESTELRTGLRLTLPMGRYLGLETDGFIGRDHPKNISWPDLYGATIRGIIIPSERIRLYTAYEIISESSAGIAGGRTEVITCGFNFNF